MHPRNRYFDNPPNFVWLASQSPEFAKFVKLKTNNKDACERIDFGNPDAVRALTKALLQCDFGLQLTLPADRLIPTVPQRLNYIHWVEDLLAALPPQHASTDVLAIDVGTGASCIYPLLGLRIHPNWKFIGTEIEADAVQCAAHNVTQNGLQDSVQVVHNADADKVLRGVIDESKKYTFCMCNPPWFQPDEEPQNKSGERPSPTKHTEMAEAEKAFHGGEVAFIKQMIMDSFEMKENILWYSSLVGKKSSLKPLVRFLRENNVPHVETTSFVQGKTHRWGVAWSFVADMQKVVSTEFSLYKKSKKPKAVPTFRCTSTSEIETIGNVRQTLEELGGMKIEGLSDKSIKVTAFVNTWKNRRRRRREKKRREEAIARGEEPPPLASASMEVDFESSPLFEAEFLADRIGTKIAIEVHLNSGDKDLMHQLFLCLKAELGAPDEQVVGNA